MNAPEDIREIILQSYRACPDQELQDLLKLLHQQEFAGGHLIADEDDSLDRLREEAAGLSANKNNGSQQMNQKRCEPIGNGLCRLNLAHIADAGIDLQTINRFFVRTANSVQGSAASFHARLNELRALICGHALPFDLAEFDAFISTYDFSRCPPFSHSQTYRRLCRPAYRVVQADFCRFFEIFRRIDTLSRTQPVVRVAIDGLCGSGKSTLAELLQQVYACPVIRMDHFFLPPELRTAERLAEAGGNIDYDRFLAEVIPGLQAGLPFQYRIFDCQHRAFGHSVAIPAARLYIVEGSYSLHPKFMGSYDLKIFLNLDQAEQHRRILERDGPDMLERFIQEWIPMENRYFKDYLIPEPSDLIF